MTRREGHPTLETLAEFRSHSPYTRSPELAWIANGLPDRLEAIFVFIKALLIHPIDARGVKGKPSATQIKRNHAWLNSVEAIVAHPKLRPLLAPQRVDIHSTREQRLILSCDHQALLCVAIFREKGWAARTRTGYFDHLVPGRWIPHWVVEVWDDQAATWRLVDPDRQIGSLERTHIRHPGALWLEYGGGEKPFDLPSYSGLKQLSGLKYALFSDLASLFGHELVGYDWRIRERRPRKPDIIRRGGLRLSASQRSDLHEIAELMAQPDAHRERLRALWQRHVGEANTRG